MAKRDTYGYRAERARAMAKTRIAGIKKILAAENLPKKTRAFFENTVRDLRAAQAATRTRTKSGKVIKGRTKEGLDASLESLKSQIESTTVYTGDRRRAFKFTQNQIKLASVDNPSSMYTKAEVKIFYRATQKAWQREGVPITARNEAILEYYGRPNLAAFIQEVLDVNQSAVKASELNPYNHMTEEQREEYEKAQRADTADGEKGSPAYMAGVITAEEFADYIVEPERQ